MREPVDSKYDLPRNLRLKIARVTRASYVSGLAELKRQRSEVVTELRAREWSHAEIAKALGMTVQYLTREFPIQKGESDE